MRNVFLFLAFFTFLGSCGQQQTGQSETQEESAPTFSLTQKWATDPVLITPESALYDAQRSVIYVSNINEGPREKDGNGFISRLGKDGKVLDLKWVEGMSAPKGLGLHGNKLYVADLDELIVIDVDQGTIIERMVIPGAKMLNDITVGADGRVFVSDTDAGKIFVLENGQPSAWLEENLSNPNGLLLEGQQLLLASMGTNDLVTINLGDKSRKVIATGLGRADGIIRVTEAGHHIVSDWSGELFLVAPDGSATSLLSTKENGINTADVGYIPEERTVLVPTFMDNRLVAYQLNVPAAE